MTIVIHEDLPNPKYRISASMTLKFNRNLKGGGNALLIYAPFNNLVGEGSAKVMDIKDCNGMSSKTKGN